MKMMWTGHVMYVPEKWTSYTVLHWDQFVNHCSVLLDKGKIIDFTVKEAPLHASIHYNVDPDNQC